MSEPTKICLLCKHFYLTAGTQDLSEVTPGEDFDMGCRKGHWEFVPYYDNMGGPIETEETYRAKLATAETCEDYKHHKDDV